jgi:hypothetical protein
MTASTPNPRHRTVKVLKRGNAKPERCTRTLHGGHRLYLGDDGKLNCQQHYDEARKTARP